MSHRERGREAERRFKEWLDLHKIPYWIVRQDLESFSRALRDLFVKRPDFMILIPHFGFLMVDVKNTDKLKWIPDSFGLNQEEVWKYVKLEMLTRVPVWFVISNEGYGFKTWFWIPVSKVSQVGEEKRKIFAVNMKHFIQVSEDDDLSRLLSRILKKYALMTQDNLPEINK